MIGENYYYNYNVSYLLYLVSGYGDDPTHTHTFRKGI